MKIKIGACYIIIVNSFKKLTYQAVVIDEDKNFITFKDKYNKTYNYNKNSIVSIVEIKKEGENDN